MRCHGYSLLFWCGLLVSHASAENRPLRITISVLDENGVAVADARVTLVSSPPAASVQCRTSPSGACWLTLPRPGRYNARAEKEDFYAAESRNLQFNASTTLEISLTHVREVREVVDVVESSPAINPEQLNAQSQISGVDVINLPYPTTRDYRNVLNYIPQVVNDIYTQPHITGAQTYQSLVLLDGFNVTQPANGQLLLRVSTDAFRSITVQTSRISAEYGKNSGGVLELNTATGDDHFRFLATDFIPSVQNKRGLTLDKINPRLTLSGPLKKGRAWFDNAADGEYANIIVTELPPGSDHDVFWRAGDLFKVQANPTSAHIVTGSFDVNFAHDQHSGMSLQNPPNTTPAVDFPMYQTSFKDQYSTSGGEIVEVGLGFNRYDFDQAPRGREPYVVTPDTAEGNYYFTAHTQADRWQFYSNVFLKPADWHGNHQFKLGVNGERLRYDFNFFRQPITYLRQDGTRSRDSVFSNPSLGERHNTELSGYAQDRWRITNRTLVEAGLRIDWDEIVRNPLLSPRLAMTYALTQSGNTKLSAGIGLFHDATPLFLIARPASGTRTDNFHDSAGTLISGPVTSVFAVDSSTLEAPGYLNWSFGLEQKLPAQVYLKAEFIQKRSNNAWAYNWLNPVELGPPGVQNYTADFQLQNHREDHFDSFEINLRRVFEKGHLIMGSYVRSRSHSSEVFDFNVDNPLFSIQQPGPYSWDAPNRVLSWGFLPLLKGFDLGYSMEYRTGFPFYLVNDQQQLAALPPTSSTPAFLRFPDYFTLNTHIEKRFRAFGSFWAIRGGFDNLTGRKNYGNVDNNVDSTQFLTFSGFSGRAFTGRIRFLGKK